MAKTPQELYKEREGRVLDAIALRKPDRVPVVLETSYFPAKYTGVNFDVAWNDYERWLEITKKTIEDFTPDMVHTSPYTPGNVFEILDMKTLKWPGHGLGPEFSHQYVEGEYMKVDEYDLLIDDLSDFLLRIIVPRSYGAMEPFNRLPPLPSLLVGHYGIAVLAELLATPPISEAVEALQKAGREMAALRPKLRMFVGEIEKLGFPQYATASLHTPFDVISDRFRGMKGSMLDMYRKPDKLLAAIDRLLPIQVSTGITMARTSATSRVFMPLHRGSAEFMSDKQFQTFYWPTLKKLILAFVDAGLTPCVFFEGDYTSRLEYLLELPKGKVLAQLDTTDIFKAKKVLKDHLCIRGNVPSSLLQVGTVQQVKDYCQKLIDEVGNDGGFIMSPRSSIDEVRPENLMAMVEFTKEYGVYR
ncbi:MAG TPA: uroporphyrinogen decarboxylase family protein [Syntrophorhabdales bacterium]|nr:uroporphyrinogen decarboxylase family protein [Syntrophorhabdales bacterium]